MSISTFTFSVVLFLRSEYFRQVLSKGPQEEIVVPGLTTVVLRQVRSCNSLKPSHFLRLGSAFSIHRSIAAKPVQGSSL